ncbi:SNF2-related protein [Microbispora bryophytorum]|uniref:SNF2-related protein n=1 Tax=Microbispora bryophytorum TaxID=1460882 RepID=UPI003714484D
MTVGEVIQEVVHGGDDDLPLVAVDADGLLGDLLSGEADRRLEPVATPAAFHGTLRPYQERGLAWLDFMSQLGLGAILADDMGLGKCLMPDSPVFVNGVLTPAADIWQNYATDTLSEDGGEWAIPLSPLFTNAIDAKGRMVQAPFTRLYRQHVRERLRRVRLDDGSEITITRRHRLLGVNGWTRDIQSGDRICVPRRIRWEGEPVDPDLTVLLAWQISEGHENRKADLRITQKNRAVLDALHERVLRIGTRFGLIVNKPTVRPARNVHELRLCSVDYAAFLSARGYKWGYLSAAKRIPDFIMAADDDTVRLFLREFFTAEGSVVAGMRMIEIASASRWLMSQLSIMLRRFGIWLRTTEKMKAATNGTGIRRPYQIGMIGGPGLRLFRDLIGFSDPVKQAKLDGVCAKPANSNVEGVPGSDLLLLARASTGLPMRHFGVGTVYFTETQELSPKSAAMAVQAMDRMLSGAAEREHLKQPQNRWTGEVAAAYRALDRDALRAVRDELVMRAEREVFYARVVSVEEIDYEGYVYDFEVAEHHNFVAGSILCHNTAQTLSLLVNEREQEEQVGATLLVCPMSLLSNWQKEAARFAPSLDVYLHHGTGRLRDEELVERVGLADLVLTTYGTALRDRDALARFGWARIVCDEAQAIKNAAARQAQAVRSLPARTRLALTGTPVENHLAELWSIMEFCNPGLLGSARAFRDRYQEPIERRGDETATTALKRATGPFVLRRLKTDKTIISDLPDKMEMKVWCTLTPEQASLYQAVVEDMMDRIAGSEGIERRGNVLAAMTRLKQVCNHPAHLLKDGSRLAGRSGKLARLEELAEEILSEGDKALVFTQYAEFGSMLQPYLAARLDRPVLWLHGGLPKKTRDALVERFQAEDEPMIFLLSLKAAGTGLNLTAACHVVHVDRWWNPAVENQATDRAFRIGQTRNVQVRKFICAGTLEERIDEMIERKRALAESVVGTGEDWIAGLSTAELRELFRLSPEAVS